MKLGRTFKLAIQSIMASKARSLLTMLGIIIGVAAVTVIVGIGNGMELYLKDSFQGIGTNLLQVQISGRGGGTRNVSPDDLYELVSDNPEVFEDMCPAIIVMGTPKVGTEELKKTTIYGVSEAYQGMVTLTMQSGRYLQYADTLSRGKVCVVGSYISKEFYDGNAVGRTIKIKGDTFEIVGVLTEGADSTEESADNEIHVPYTAATKLNGSAIVNIYAFTVTSEDQIQAGKNLINARLYETFQTTDAYTITSLAEMLDMMSSMINVVVTILTLIAGISLVVGGIGIMNIMLVSVSERTREIGIRKAVGAKRRHILLQFVIEAGLTSAIGGIIGIIFGYVLSSGGTALIFMMLGENLTITPSPAAVMVAFGISAGIGVLFGYLPARKAALLNPIDALRYD